MLRLARCRACLHRFLTILLSSEFLCFSVMIKILLCSLLSYYTYKLGYFIGANSRTPELASALSDPRVLFESVHPKDLRWYAWMTLWSCVGVLGYAGCMIWSSIDREIAAGYTAANAVSPKLPTTSGYQAFRMPHAAVVPQTATVDKPRTIRSKALSRILYTVPILVFAIAFIKKQHIGTPLVCHPVNSPLILQNLLDPTSDIDSFQQQHGNENWLSEGLEPSGRPTYPVTVRQEKDLVPPIVHFVFGMSASFGGKPFGYAHYLSMYSAMVETKPEKVMFWHHYLPSTPDSPNWWFDRIQKEASTLGIEFEAIRAREFDTIFNNPITKFAHKADVIRLEALLQYGGIYLDLDVYTIRSFSPFLNFPTVLALEGGVEKLPLQGLCNGIIVAERNSSFLRRWYEGYRDFRDEDWAGMSVKFPLKLAMRHPEELLVLDPFAWFYPGWNNNGLRLVHSRQAELSGEGWSFDDSSQFAYHAWSSFTTKKWLSRITPENVFEIETSFNLLVRRWTSEGLRRDWKRAKAQGLVS